MAASIEAARIQYVSRPGHPRRGGGRLGDPERRKKIGVGESSVTGGNTLVVTPSEVPVLDRTDGNRQVPTPKGWE